MIPLQRLSRPFYLRPTLIVARDLLGKYLVRRYRRRLLVVRIVEVEAYLGARDPASHSSGGKTPRNEVMFMQGGHLYVYFTYGMHFCCNVVTERAGVGAAVLIRAGEPIEGVRLMARRRGTSDPALLCSGPARLCQALGIGRKENGTDLRGDSIWIAEERATAVPDGEKSGGHTYGSLQDGIGGRAGRGPGARKSRSHLADGRTGTTDSRTRIGIRERGDVVGSSTRTGTREGREIICSSTRIGIREGREQRWRFYLKGNPFVSKGRPSGPDGRRDQQRGAV